MIPTILNPLTNRYVRVGGAVYESLLRKGIIPDRATTRRRKAWIPPDSYRVSRRFRDYPIDRSETPWGEKKPHHLSERRELMAACGPSCFLMPDELKFPICNKISVEEGCAYNCRGLKAASARAGEWKYTRVLEKSRKLTEKLGCYKKKKK